MNIEIRNPELQARLQRQLDAAGSTDLEQVLARLLDTQEEQDRWLSEGRDVINRKIHRGINQIERGEGISEEEARAKLSALKSRRK